MSVAVEHRTVSLWPVNASPVDSGRRQPTGALAAIMAGYRHDRAGIISGDPSTATGQLGEESPAAPALLTHPPTVPLVLRSDPAPAEVPAGLPDQGREATTLWARLVRTGRPAPRGRHSALRAPQGS
jgi:hypothetical protein